MSIASEDAPVEHGMIDREIPVDIQKCSRCCAAIGADGQGVAAAQRGVVAGGKVDQDVIGSDSPREDNIAVEAMAACTVDIDDYKIAGRASNCKVVPVVEGTQGGNGENTVTGAVQRTAAGSERPAIAEGQRGPNLSTQVLGQRVQGVKIGLDVPLAEECPASDRETAVAELPGIRCRELDGASDRSGPVALKLSSRADSDVAGLITVVEAEGIAAIALV